MQFAYFFRLARDATSLGWRFDGDVFTAARRLESGSCRDIERHGARVEAAGKTQHT